MAETTEQDLLAAAHLGRSAEELLTEPLIERWFDDLDLVLTEAMRADGRENAAHWHDMMDCAAKLRSVLHAYMRTGAMAADALRRRGDRIVPISRFKFGPERERKAY